MSSASEITLHPATHALVMRFATALMEKLSATEQKYGRTTDWTKDDWEADCQRKLMAHVAKGDPLDVAAYAAFCWHHGWSTSQGDIKYQPWECAGRKQALPEPGDCDWPVCGCDPRANKVIEALQESGALALSSRDRSPPRAAGG
jgi:hypothetical protein